VATAFFTPFFPATRTLIQTRHSDIYVAVTLIALGYPWLYSGLTVGRVRRGLRPGYMIEDKGKIVPADGRQQGRLRPRF